MVETHEVPGQLQIRGVATTDLELFFEHQRDREATRLAAFPSRERDAFMAHWAKIRADQTVFTQTIVVDGQVAGNIVSWEASGHQEVGYWIGRDFWGRGVGTKALALFLDQMKVRPLHAYVAPHNIGSIRVLEKSGFRRVASQDVPPSTADDGGVAYVVFVLET